METIGEAAPLLDPCIGHQVYGDWRAEQEHDARWKDIADLIAFMVSPRGRWLRSSHTF